MENIAFIVEQSEKRNFQAIAECNEEIRIIEERKQRLVLANQQYHLITSLKTSGASAWYQLTSENKWKKENILAVFLSGKIPPELKEERFQQCAPETICNDRDVFLARLARDDFTDFYYGYEILQQRIGSHPFHIPEPLLADKEVVAAVVNRYPEILMQDVLPAELLKDIDVFRAYLTSKHLQRFRSDATTARGILVGKFSETIRGNAELMLEAAEALKYTITVYDHFAASLEDNLSFALRLPEYYDMIPDHALKRFSGRVRSDPAAVLAFVRKNGRCLKDASETLRQNEEIVREACKNRALALRHCEPGPTNRRLCADKSFMLNIFGGLICHEPRFWQMLSPSLKCDRDLVVAAQASKSLVFTDLPQVLTSDPAFWLDVIARDSSFWFALPDKYKDDPSFVRAIKKFESEELVLAAFDRFPCLRSNRDVWTTIIDSIKGDEYLPNVIEDHASEKIQLDKDLMLSACKKDVEVLEILSSQLQRDKEILEAAVEASFLALMSFSNDAQCMYPDLVAKAISGIAEDDCAMHVNYYVDDIAEDLWTNLDVTRAWLRAGGEIHGKFPDSMLSSKEFGLLVAEYCGMNVFIYRESEALRSDKEFMVQAVDKNGMMFLGAAGGLNRDFEVAEAAFGGTAPQTQSLVETFVSVGRDTHYFAFLRKVLHKARYGLNAHDGFVKRLLCGMSVDAGAECHLPTLERGAETSLAWKKLIAEYVGVPTGNKLRVLRRVAENLEYLDNYDSDDDSDETLDDDSADALDDDSADALEDGL